MHIKFNGLVHSINAYQDKSVQTRKLDTTVISNHLQQPDEVILSQNNTNTGLSNVVQLVRNSSDVRQELVEQIGEKVRSGNYQVNAYDLASKFIQANEGIVK